jgi:hypothetical protein
MAEQRRGHNVRNSRLWLGAALAAAVFGGGGILFRLRPDSADPGQRGGRRPNDARGGRGGKRGDLKRDDNPPLHPRAALRVASRPGGRVADYQAQLPALARTVTCWTHACLRRSCGR